jgi:rfaE bifunctional protein nucleotidyltransferase chain/domain
MQTKVKTVEELRPLLAILRAAGKKIVFTNGCFDILHSGHVFYLRKAKELGDVLVIGLNSDLSVKRLKGPERPINSQKDRSEVMSALEFVDYITIFEEDTPHDLIKVLSPDVLVKGGDYSVDKVVGREFAGETVIIPFLDGYSTTKIVEKMKEEKKCS